MSDVVASQLFFSPHRVGRPNHIIYSISCHINVLTTHGLAQEFIITRIAMYYDMVIRPCRVVFFSFRFPLSRLAPSLE